MYRTDFSCSRMWKVWKLASWAINFIWEFFMSIGVRRCLYYPQEWIKMWFQGEILSPFLLPQTPSLASVCSQRLKINPISNAATRCNVITLSGKQFNFKLPIFYRFCPTSITAHRYSAVAKSIKSLPIWIVEIFSSNRERIWSLREVVFPLKNMYQSWQRACRKGFLWKL